MSSFFDSDREAAVIDSSDSDSGSECEDPRDCRRKCSRFCSRCEDIKFDESEFGGYETADHSGTTFLQLNPLKSYRVEAEGPEATGIGAYTAIFLTKFEDKWPELPNLKDSANRCDFCKFLRKGLRSDEVRLAILDQADPGYRMSGSVKMVDIRVTLSYSWEPERRKLRRSFAGNTDEDPDRYSEYLHVGLDALYVQVASVNPSRTVDRSNPVVPKGVMCELRYAVVMSRYGSTDAAKRLRLRLWPESAWDDDAENWVRQQFNQCCNGNSNHDYCKKLWYRLDSNRSKETINGEKGPWLPTVLIKLDYGPPHLVNSSRKRDQDDLNYIPKYAAFSYCWADRDVPQLKLTSKNYYELMNKIPMDELSHAQRDAITVTKAMGFSYLWNDALCIPQDDKESWEAQCTWMGDIYRHAACTLVSLRSNFRERFLNGNVQKISIPYQSSLRPGISGSYVLRFDGVENARSGVQVINKISKTLSSNRWVTRGWTFQEQNNSLRMIFFWPGGIRFNCPISSALYTGGVSNDNTDQVSKSYWWEDRADTSIDRVFNRDAWNDSYTVVKDIFGDWQAAKDLLHFQWLRFATDYSHRVFTQEMDMIPALWSTAQLFKSRLRGRYLMGAWEGDFWSFLWRFGNDAPHLDLMYTRAHYNMPDSGAVGPIASWSWIGNPCIKFLTYAHDECEGLEDFRTEYTLDTSRVRERDNQPSKGYEESVLEFRTKITKIYGRFHNPESGICDNEVSFSYIWSNNIVWCAMDWRDAMRKRDDGTVVLSYGIYFMLLASARVKDRSWDGPRAAVGLVLTDSRRNGKYYRVGIFVCKGFEHYGGMQMFDDCDTKTIEIG